MNGRPLWSRSGSFRADKLGRSALHLVGSLCFALFVLGVLSFTFIAATFHPSSKLASFLTSATFRSDDSVRRTGEDFLNASSTDDDPSAAIRLSEVSTGGAATSSSAADGDCDDKGGPVDCKNPEVYHVMMHAAIETFRNNHFYRFGKPVPGAGDGRSCDMAWRFRPKDAKRAAFHKDYRRFELAPGPNCTYSVVRIGDYHTGVNARKKKNKLKGDPSADAWDVAGDLVPKKGEKTLVVPVVGDAVSDTLRVVGSKGKFGAGKYLIYTGGGDRCKPMNHYLRSFLCALGEAQYLNRTLVMDLSICLNSMYTSTNQDEEGKDFRFYFDFEHLKDSASVLDESQFWKDWFLWEKTGQVGLHLVENFKVTPMKLAKVKDALIMRKFGAVEPDNYWCRVCEGETESAIQQPWHLVLKSRRLMDIVSGIASRMDWDFDAIHVVRGEKARNAELWPNLARDTSPEALLSTLGDKIDDRRHLYIATNEPDTSLFDPLKDKYTVHFLDDFKDLWGENSEWYMETQSLNNGIPVEFDGYMRVEVDTEVFLRGKMQIETFNDLTTDCKDGINTCQMDS